MLDDGEVVADEQHREAEIALQVLQQVDDLRLDRDIERGHRLVAYDQVGIGGERARDADALALAAGELVRPASAASRGSRTLSISAADRARRDRRPKSASPKLRIGSATMSFTRMRGLRLENGS